MIIATYTNTEKKGNGFQKKSPRISGA